MEAGAKKGTCRTYHLGRIDGIVLFTISPVGKGPEVGQYQQTKKERGRGRGESRVVGDAMGFKCLLNALWTLIPIGLRCVAEELWLKRGGGKGKIQERRILGKCNVELKVETCLN